MLPAYWGEDIHLSGLGVLFLGAQTQAWGWASPLIDEANLGVSAVLSDAGYDRSRSVEVGLAVR